MLDDVAQGEPQVRHGALGMEIDVDDVLVLLRRILGVADRAVGAAAEPLRMLLEPGMIERTLDGEIERDLQALLGRGGDQAAKILRRAERRMNRVVPALDATDGIGAAGIVWPGRKRVVATLAVGRADRMDRREVEDIEAHVADARQGLDDVVERAEGARKELVPARELGLRPLDFHGDRFRTIGQGPIVNLGDLAAGFGARQQGDVLVDIAVGQCFQDRLSLRRTQMLARIGDLGGDVDAGAMLDLQRMAKGRVFVAPRLDREQMPADALGRQGAAPAIVADRYQRCALPLLLVRRPPQQLGRQLVVAVGEDVGFDRDRPTDDALGRKRPAAHLRCHALDDDRRAQSGGARRPPIRPLALAHGTDAAETRHANFARRQAVGQRLTGHRPGIAQQCPGGRIERIEAYRDRLRRRRIVVDQGDNAVLRRATVGGVEPRQNGDVGRSAREPAHFSHRVDRRQAFGFLGRLP